jgi:hypothetical protein
MGEVLKKMAAAAVVAGAALFVTACGQPKTETVETTVITEAPADDVVAADGAAMDATMDPMAPPADMAAPADPMAAPADEGAAVAPEAAPANCSP